MSNKHSTRKATTTKRTKRRGAIAVFTALLMIPLMAMLAFAVDYGYLLKTRASLQRAADASALAAVRDLLPAADGSQDLAIVRATAKQYAAANIAELSGFSVLDADIEIGRYDPTTVYKNFTILNTGVYDTVRVTLRRDSQANASVPLFFARALGINNCDITVTATAVLQKAKSVQEGAGVLPFSIPQAEWNAASDGDIWSVYGDARLVDDAGAQVPGNWGTLDIGAAANSTADIVDQILTGLRQVDLDALYAETRIPQDTHIDGAQPWNAEGDPGLSIGMKLAIEAIHGETRLIPIYDTVSSGEGNNLEYHVVGWAGCEVVDSTWQGQNNTYVRIQKRYVYDGLLVPVSDLSVTSGYIETAFTVPTLVQ